MPLLVNPAGGDETSFAWFDTAERTSCYEYGAQLTAAAIVVAERLALTFRTRNMTSGAIRSVPRLIPAVQLENVEQLTDIDTTAVRPTAADLEVAVLLVPKLLSSETVQSESKLFVMEAAMETNRKEHAASALFVRSAVLSGGLSLLFLVLFLSRALMYGFRNSSVFLPLAIAAFGVFITSAVSSAELRANGPHS